MDRALKLEYYIKSIVFNRSFTKFTDFHVPPAYNNRLEEFVKENLLCHRIVNVYHSDADWNIVQFGADRLMPDDSNSLPALPLWDILYEYEQWYEENITSNQFRGAWTRRRPSSYYILRKNKDGWTWHR